MLRPEMSDQWLYPMFQLHIKKNMLLPLLIAFLYYHTFLLDMVLENCQNRQHNCLQDNFDIHKFEPTHPCRMYTKFQKDKKLPVLQQDWYN